MSTPTPEQPAAPDQERAPEGWFGPQGSKRFHYFNAELRALCGKWMIWRHPADVGMDWNEGIGYLANGDCAECKRRLAKREEAS